MNCPECYRRTLREVEMIEYLSNRSCPVCGYEESKLFDDEDHVRVWEH